MPRSLAFTGIVEPAEAVVVEEVRYPASRQDRELRQQLIRYPGILLPLAADSLRRKCVVVRPELFRAGLARVVLARLLCILGTGQGQLRGILR